VNIGLFIACKNSRGMSLKRVSLLPDSIGALRDASTCKAVRPSPHYIAYTHLDSTSTEKQFLFWQDI